MDTFSILQYFPPLVSDFIFKQLNDHHFILKQLNHHPMNHPLTHHLSITDHPSPRPPGPNGRPDLPPSSTTRTCPMKPPALPMSLMRPEPRMRSTSPVEGEYLPKIGGWWSKSRCTYHEKWWFVMVSHQPSARPILTEQASEACWKHIHHFWSLYMTLSCVSSSKVGHDGIWRQSPLTNAI